MMTVIQDLYNRMKDPNVIRMFEQDYGMCFLQESANISDSNEVLTFSLNHHIMSISNFCDDGMSVDKLLEFEEDCVYFDDFGRGIDGLSFDCTEEEFNNHDLENKHIMFSDMTVLKQIYQQFEKYLDLESLKQLSRNQ